MIRRPLGWLLYLANARMSGSVYRRERYALKDRLLHRFGTRVGDDVQHIVEDCWGYYDDGRCLGRSCTKCGGTGVYDERVILLERWQLGGRIFHSNPRQAYGEANQLKTRAGVIRGRIQHDAVRYGAAEEALLWLALIFDRKLFWRELKSHRTCGWQRRPLKALQVVVFEARMFFSVTRCYYCRGRILQGFSKGQRWICRRCTRRFRASNMPRVTPSGFRPRAFATTASENDLPF